MGSVESLHNCGKSSSLFPNPLGNGSGSILILSRWFLMQQHQGDSEINDPSSPLGARFL